MRPYRGPALSATALGLILSLTPFLALAQEKTAEQKKEIIEEQTATGDSQNLGTIVLDGSDRASAETSYLSGTTIGRVETDPKKLPATVSAYAAKRIEEQNIRSNLDLMQGTPGWMSQAMKAFSVSGGLEPKRRWMEFPSAVSWAAPAPICPPSSRSKS